MCYWGTLTCPKYVHVYRGVTITCIHVCTLWLLAFQFITLLNSPSFLVLIQVIRSSFKPWLVYTVVIVIEIYLVHSRLHSFNQLHVLQNNCFFLCFLTLIIFISENIILFFTIITPLILLLYLLTRHTFVNNNTNNNIYYYQEWESSMRTPLSLHVSMSSCHHSVFASLIISAS